jgi:hypothetical protein
MTTSPTEGVCQTCGGTNTVKGTRIDVPWGDHYRAEPCPSCTGKPAVERVSDARLNQIGAGSAATPNEVIEIACELYRFRNRRADEADNTGTFADTRGKFRADEAGGGDVFWAVRNTHNGENSYLRDTDEGWEWVRKVLRANMYATREQAESRISMFKKGGSPYEYSAVRVTPPLVAAILRPAMQAVDVASKLGEVVNRLEWDGRQEYAELVKQAIAALTRPMEDRRDAEKHGDAIGNHAFASSDKHLSGYRLTLGFDTLEQMQDAHTAAVYFGKKLRGRS